MQEISFWLNLKRALAAVQQKLDSPMIQLTMEILKQGKRFHATVSFDNDTGLERVRAHVVLGAFTCISGACLLMDLL